MSIAAKYRPYYTYEDYCQWEGRWELIEGMPYAMSPAPVPDHQRVCVRLCLRLEQALEHCKKCKVYLPIDWKITEDTIVQPDILIVCKPINKKFLDFAPDLVVEILSPSTASKDRGEKMELYQSQKVKYYLIVDPKFKKIEIYQFVNNQYQPVAVNPDKQAFIFEETDCKPEVNLLNIWE
jgi:Uma2 family endonuclease